MFRQAKRWCKYPMHMIHRAATIVVRRTFPIPSLSRPSRVTGQRHRGRHQTKAPWTRRREAEDELAALSGG
jgi:hypothetical protein